MSPRWPRNARQFVGLRAPTACSIRAGQPGHAAGVRVRPQRLSMSERADRTADASPSAKEPELPTLLATSGRKRGSRSSSPSTTSAPGLAITRDDEELPVLDPVTDYEKIGRVGEGTYGVVYKARHRVTGEVVALKRVRMEREKDGVPVTAVRELRVLQKCRHPNVVNLLRVLTGAKADSVFFAFEFCEHDLARLIDSLRTPFTVSEVKCLMQQLLRAVAFLHGRWVVHRDIKLSNLLLTNTGELKLCDFGLARYFRAYQVAYTPGVVTLWYRAPEILLGDDSYTEAIDMWAVGCVLGELLQGSPLFPGQTEQETVSRIVALLGHPTEAIWPGMSSLRHINNFRMPRQPYNYLARTFRDLSETGIDLLGQLLLYDPEKRINAREALKHPWFTEHPLPKATHMMPTFPSTQAKEAERNKREGQQGQGAAGGGAFGRGGAGAYGDGAGGKGGVSKGGIALGKRPRP